MEEFVKKDGIWYLKISPAIVYFECLDDIPDYIKKIILNRAGE